MSKLEEQPRIRPEITSTRSYWLSVLIGFLIAIAVAVRVLLDHVRRPTFFTAAGLLAAILLFLLVQPFLSRRLARYSHLIYFIQVGLIQSLGLLRPHKDIWALLYVSLCLQIWQAQSRRAAAFWSVVCLASMIITLTWEFGWLAGLGFSLNYSAGGLIFLSYNSLVLQAEAARAESQKLLSELRQAHNRLKEVAEQAEALSAARERDRLARELHDSVGQMIFSINLTAESTRLLLEKEPQRAPEQLDRLQELTGSALSQMRVLISQWRPG